MNNLYWTSSLNVTYIAGAVVCQIAGASPGGFGTILSRNAWLGADFWLEGVFQSPGQGCASLTRVGGSSVPVSAHVRPASRRSSSAAICWPSRRLDRATASSARAGVQALIITPAATCSSRSGIVLSRQCAGSPKPELLLSAWLGLTEEPEEAL